jgi:O-acetyl-ADP-ribose deacetylase (regulator of RNase III)
MTEKKINNKSIRLVKADITDLEVEAFVFYAAHDLKLGTGWGGAISVRGGPSIQKELDEIGKLETCQSVVTGAGELKASCIVHSVGPRFQEKDEERKLGETMRSALKVAEEKGVKQLAFPPMGCGFYGIPLDVSARVMFEALGEYLKGQTGLEEVVVCVNDTREMAPFEQQLSALAQ